MLEFCFAGIIGLIGYYRHINKENINEKKYIKTLTRQVTNKWNLCMQYANIKNKNDESFEILDVIQKAYGCDCIISIPYGLNAKKIFDNLPMIEQNFGCDIYIKISKEGNSIYSNIVLFPEELTEIEKIKFKWYKIMFSNDKLYNQNLDTFNIVKTKKCKYGYDLLISIPLGQSNNIINSLKDIIQTNFNCTIYIEEPIENKFVLKLITQEFDDNYPYAPIKVSSTQLFVGMTYDYQPVIVDLKNLAHMLYTGMNGSGKTVCLLTALTNLIYYQNEFKWELYMSMISSKKDLRIFKDVKQCKYYAETLEDSYFLLKYLYNQMDYRNKLFNSDKENYIVNIYEWNEKHPHQKLKDIIFATDEISFFMSDEFDTERDTTLKDKCINIFIRLLKEGRSVGVHVLGSLQRPDKENLPPIIKSQMGIKVCFYQPNDASSLVVLDSNEATKLKKKREAIVDADERYFMKTLYITNDMILKYISKSIEKDHKYINIKEKYPKFNGNDKKIEKKDEKVLKFEEKSHKNKKDTNKKDNHIYSFPKFSNKRFK